MQPYDHEQIEPKWQKIWAKNKMAQAKDPAKGKKAANAKKFYSLVEFPYPSGDGLHVGHPRPYIGMDVISRKRRMQGYNVLYPIGWDAFGLPTENYAIKTGKDPRVVTKENSDTFRRQIQSLGVSFDWSREVNTTDPKYYKWTQWIFLQFLKEGLAYKKKMTINWCPKDLIGLANEEVIDGKCERCGTPVEKREKEQWMLAITKYADKLLAGLDAVEYDMPKLVDKTNPHQSRKPLIKRNVAHAIVFDPRSKKYLIIRNKKFAWDTVIIGGIEEGETAEETARREVREETGYTDIEFKRLLGGKTEAHYYTKHKGENRIAYAQAVYFELKGDARVPLAEGEDADNEILWVDEADFVPGKMVNSELGIWLERIKNPAAGWPKPLLDWPESIKESQRNWIGKSEGAEFDFRLDIKNVKPRFVILHGYKGSAKTDFIPWLKKELENHGHEVETPELPNSNNPVESEQVEYVLKNCRLDENTVVIGHSLGSIVAMKALMKLNKPVSGLVLVAPAHDPNFGDAKVIRSYHKNFDWNIDTARIQKLTSGRIAVLTDAKDKEYRVKYGKYLAGELHARLVETTAVEEHFCAEKEPEILKSITPAVTVFTTRPDTLFGVTYVVLAPEHPWVQIMLPQLENKKEVEDYIAKAKNQTDIVRTDAKREKTGVELKGLSAVNPANGEKVPVWIADYVLADYGTGAVMAVPAHDERDWEFAKKYGLPIKYVIAPYFLDKTENSKPRKGIETKNRIIGVGIVKHWLEDKYLMLDWKNGWTGFITGGLEGSENLEKTVIRETQEETGYKNVKFIKHLGGPNLSDFYAPHKKLNQSVTGFGVYLELQDDSKNEVLAEEYEKHNPVWKKKNEVLPFLKKGSPMGDSRYSELYWERLQTDNYVWKEAGKLIDSSLFTGKDSTLAGTEIAASFGTPKTTYKLRDWVFSRQRYWGEPIPVIHCPECGIVPVPEKDLPVKLPEIKNYKPTETGESPLAAISDWVNVKCPKCGSKKAKRETDTMPNWAGSSWYYLRYTDPHNAKVFAATDKLKYWTPVDWYNGGNEHTTLHLLYSRFWHKFLFDQGLVPTPEPYTKRTSHGLILAKGGEKMSKSKGNVINPDGIVEMVGADSLRLYEMFMGPFDQAIAWDENGIVGCRRFIERVWKLAEKINDETPATIEANTLVHRTIKKVSEDIEAMRFNTAVSALMIAVNELEKMAEKSGGISRENYAAILSLLAPFAPHVTEELWQKLDLGKGKSAKSVHQAPWPIFDPSKIAEATVRIAVQVNGKSRSSFEIPSEEARQMSEQGAREKAVSLDEIKKWIYGKEIKKVIYVKGRLINIVLTV